MAFKIAQYEIAEQLYESRCTLVCRGCRTGSSESVIVKVLKPAAATEGELTRFRREFSILSKVDLPGVAKAQALEEFEGSLLMVLEDIGGQALDRLCAGAPLPLAQFLELAVGLADTVAGLHHLRIIHKDVNPAHIVFNPGTRQFRLIDFGIADNLPQRTVEPQPPSALEGTLAYISPEQTGRMNRAVDYRSDFYSLGITFYRILTGKMPFEADDALGMVHCHIAGTPIAPHVLDPAIPEPVSQIILKLMAKMPEDRYQSGWGLKVDLETCLRGLTEQGAVREIELGREDASDRLQMPERLYGRQKETGRLIDALTRVAAGGRELVLVAGRAGVGKTALVHETYGGMLEKQGHFVEGKFDQLQRNAPYFGWIQAFKSFVDYILMEGEAELAQWKHDILSAVRNSGKVLTDVIPSMELIIGSQPPIPDLAGPEARNRFNYVIREFVKIVATEGHPLVVFLDDLQWIDAASLELLQMLLTSSDITHLLLVGSYRDSDTDAAHPLIRAVNELEGAAVPLQRLTLTPLSEEDLNAWLAAGLRVTTSDSRALVRFVHSKSGGNPFFTLQILRTMEDEGLVAFDRAERQWKWDLSVIDSKEIADNVADLLSRRVQQLPASTRHFLQRAACLGARFELATVSCVAEESSDDSLANLQTALEERLVVTSGSGYRFVHDRVQQAAYSLIPSDERKAVHWRIGRLLLRETPHRAREGRFFDAINHLDIGAPLFATPEEKVELAEMNRDAGRKAKATAAFAAAMDYFETGLGLLGEERWSDQYPLMLALHQEAAEAAYLCGRYDRMKELAALVHLHAVSLLDEVPVFETEIRALNAQGELLPAVRYGLTCLERLGMRLTETPSPAEVEECMERTRSLLKQKTIEGLASLPPMTSPEHLARARILSEIGESAYVASPQFFLVWASSVAELSLRHGNCVLSPFAYAAYALALCATGAHVETGWRLAKAAIGLLDSLGIRSLRCRLLNIYGCMIQPKTEHLRNAISTLQESVDSAGESGDLTSGSYAAFNASVEAFFMGEPLDALEQRLQTNMEIIAGMRRTYIWNWVAFHLRAVQRLRGATEFPGQPGAFDETSWLVSANATNDRCGLAYYYLSKLTAVCLLGESKPGEALAYLAELKSHQDGFQATFGVPLSHFYGSLALMKFGEASGSLRFDEIRENLSKLKSLASLAPVNFQHKCDLIEAELARVEGKSWEAAELYEKAIVGARVNGFLQEEALSHELAAVFYLELGMEDAAQIHILRAHTKYGQWQAREKVRALEARFPQWLAPKARLHPGAESSSLDLGTVMKATHAISVEIEMDRLLAEIMRIVIENAGAQSGFLLLERNDKWEVAAKGDIGAAQVEAPSPAGVEDSGLVSPGIVRFVARTKEAVVLDDAAKQGKFAADPHIRRARTKSLLCAPLLSRGKLAGVVYLENNLVTGAFTPERVLFLEMLLSQAATSLENATIYEALRESETKYRQIVDTSTEGIWAIGPDLTTTFVNARMTEMLGYTSEEMIGKPAAAFMFEEDRPDHYRKMETRRQGVPESYERRYRRKDGQVMWAFVSAAPILDQQRRFKGSFAMFTDITERKQAEQDVALMNFALSNVREMAFLVDENARFHFVNEETCRLLGYSRAELLDMGVPDVSPGFSAESWPIHWCEVKARHSLLFEGHLRAKDGHLFPVEINANYFEYDGQGYHMTLVRDITDRKREEEERSRLQEQLQQAQKLESVGRLAGGVAHDFNNLLTVINGYSELLLAQMDASDPRRGKVEQIREAGERAAGLTKPLLAFSRRQVVEPRSLNVDAVIADAERMLRPMLREDIELITRRSTSSGRVMADPVQLHQVLLNLVVNARDAMPKGGRLLIETANVDLDDEYRASHPGTPNDLVCGPYVLLTVSDTGIGMDETVRQHVFEPFYTTKETGTGTGLGLSTAYGIVSQAAGRIWVQSESGKGATFSILLPRIHDKVEVEEPAVAVPVVSRGSETILIVEDQEAVRRLASDALKTYGYNILEAANGPDALVLTERYSGRIDLLLTDVVMPGMTGLELADQLRARTPEIKVVCMSGYMTDALGHWGVEHSGVAFISKPFTPVALAAEVRRALSPSTSTPVILVAGADAGIQRLFRTLLVTEGYEVLEARDSNQVLDIARARRLDLIVVDLSGTEQGNIEAVQAIRQGCPYTKIIVMSGDVEERVQRVAELVAASASLVKPVDRTQLLAAVRAAVG